MIGQLLDGRYEIIQALSTGSFGHTYIAEDTRIPGNPQCVVKHLKPATNNANMLATAERLFWSEAESLAQLGNHDQIPRILDFFEENQDFFLVQEFVDGHPLTEELIPGERLSEAYVIALLQDVLPILEFIHQRDVIHRDLKPGNIIRRKQDRKLVLIDFGAVKQVREFTTTIQDRLSSTPLSIGTPGYMSSEQMRGRPRPNSDIYALGMIAIQALTGMYPHYFQEDPQTAEILWQHEASVSPELAKVLEKMVRYDFQDRYQSATEVLLALHELENSACEPTLQMARQSVAAKTPVRELMLEWVEAGQKKTRIIRDRQISKNPGTVRIGRDPAKCDIVLSEPTVSGLHVEIFFNSQEQLFYLRNLGKTNPAVVDGQSLPIGEVVLNQGSYIQLGKLVLRVVAMTLDSEGGGVIVQQDSADSQPSEDVPQQPNTPPPSLAPTVLPPPVPNTKLNELPPLLLTRPVWRRRRRSVRKLFLRFGLGVVVVGGAIAGFAYLGSNPTDLKAKTTPTPTITRPCEAVIAANKNLRTEPTDADNSNIVPEYSQLPIEQKLPVTGKKALEKNGSYWLEIELPSEDLAYAHSTVIKNYSEIEACLKRQGKTFHQVNAAALITTPSATNSTSASFFDNSKIEFDLSPKQKALNSTPASLLEDNTIEPELSPKQIVSNSIPADNSRKSSNHQILRKQPLYRGKRLLDEGPEILVRAREKAVDEDLRGAIKTASTINSNSYVYREAVAAIAKWQKELDEKNECRTLGGMWRHRQCIVPSPRPTQQPSQHLSQEPTQSYICWCSSNQTDGFESKENSQGKPCDSDGDEQPDGLYQCRHIPQVPMPQVSKSVSSAN